MVGVQAQHAEPQEIGEYLSALANAALLNQPRGYLVFGIDDATHAVVGTRFDPYATKGKGNQDLLPWLAAGLRPNTGVERTASSTPTAALSCSKSVPPGASLSRFRASQRARWREQDGAAQPSREGARAVDAGQRLVGERVRSGEPGGSRS